MRSGLTNAQEPVENELQDACKDCRDGCSAWCCWGQVKFLGVWWRHETSWKRSWRMHTKWQVFCWNIDLKWQRNSILFTTTCAPCWRNANHVNHTQNTFKTQDGSLHESRAKKSRRVQTLCAHVIHRPASRPTRSTRPSAKRTIRACWHGWPCLLSVKPRYTPVNTPLHELWRTQSASDSGPYKHGMRQVCS